MNYTDILASLAGKNKYLSHLMAGGDDQFKWSQTVTYKCPTCLATFRTANGALQCCPATAAPPAMPEKVSVTRNREISMVEARELGILDAMLRKRMRVENMDIDYDWLNDNCTGLYMISDDKVAFELDEDYALFKLKFHAS